MKKLLVGLCAMFMMSASATTVNLNWLVDGATFAQTTCETGGNFVLPNPNPTKYGYTFSGWIALIKGTVDQNGTPSPTNPIEPVFYQDNNGMILRAINDSVADTYSPSTGKITRRVGIKVLKGTENISVRGNASNHIYLFIDMGSNGKSGIVICSHFSGGTSTSLDGIPSNTISGFDPNQSGRFSLRFDDANTVGELKSWLAEQYANGTPVTVYYPLATPTEEVWNGQ